MIYLDSLDSYYSIGHEPKAKLERDYAGIGAIIKLSDIRQQDRFNASAAFFLSSSCCKN
jgi:hypothetical protein